MHWQIQSCSHIPQTSRISHLLLFLQSNSCCSSACRRTRFVYHKNGLDVVKVPSCSVRTRRNPAGGHESPAHRRVCWCVSSGQLVSQIKERRCHGAPYWAGRCSAALIRSTHDCLELIFSFNISGPAGILGIPRTP